MLKTSEISESSDDDFKWEEGGSGFREDEGRTDLKKAPATKKRKREQAEIEGDGDDEAPSVPKKNALVPELKKVPRGLLTNKKVKELRKSGTKMSKIL